MDLPKTQAFCVYKTTKAFIVYKNKDLISLPFSIVAPSFQYFKNGHQFLIMGLIPSFYRNHHSKKQTSSYYSPESDFKISALYAESEKR